MKSIFDRSAREELNQRINSLSHQHQAHWGKMDVYQMLKHCSLCEDMIFGKVVFKRVFIGRLIGKLALKRELSNKPFSKNSPTHPKLKTDGQKGDIESEKKEWIAKINEYSNFNNFDFVHPFFGKMTKEQLGLFVYKHADHHLRQFGV